MRHSEIKHMNEIENTEKNLKGRTDQWNKTIHELKVKLFENIVRGRKQ